MPYASDNWVYSADTIILDSEFDSDRLGWKHGDYFKFTNINGKQILLKVEQLEQFIVDGIIKK